MPVQDREEVELGIEAGSIPIGKMDVSKEFRNDDGADVEINFPLKAGAEDRIETVRPRLDWGVLM
jgi:hypothetical protein